MKHREFSIDTLDSIDKKILIELQKDGRMSNVKLASRVGLSPTPCLERVKKLEKEGYIKNYSANVDARKVGSTLLVYVEITLDKSSPDVFSRFNRAVQSVDVIQECHLVSGNFDYLLKTRVTDMDDYRSLLGDTLLRLPSVSESRTYVVMEEVKENHFVAIKS